MASNPKARKKARTWPPGTMRDGIRKVENKRGTRRRGKPAYSYQVPYRDANGKQTSETFDDLDAAKAFRDERRSKKHKGVVFDLKPGRISFDDYADKWLTNKDATKKTGTSSQYRSHFKNHAVKFFGGRTMIEIRPGDLQDFVTFLRRKQRLAPSTIETVYNIVASMFNTAVRDKVLSESPCTMIELPTVPKHEVVPFEPWEVHALEDNICARYRATVALAAHTGLRQAECFGLIIDNLDIRRHFVTVDRQIIPGRKFDLPKTKASVRTVPLDKDIVAILREHLEQYPVTEQKVEWDGGGTEAVKLVFTTARGAPLQKSVFNDAFNRAAVLGSVDLSVARDKFHRLRHTYVSLLIRENVNPKKIQVRIGHESIAETMDTYGHLYADDDDTLRQAICSALARTSQTALPQNVSTPYQPER